MSTADKISQMLVPTFRYWKDAEGKNQPVTELNDELTAALQAHGFGGVIFFAQNAADNEAAARLLNDMQKANAAVPGRTQLFTAIDQEGGNVSRLGRGTMLPGNMALGATGSADRAAAAGTLAGLELSALGFNLNFAPVVDVNSNPSNPVIGIRSFSDDPALTAKLGAAFMTAQNETGVISSLKHFPGHGDTATDSHTGLPSVSKTYEELKASELVPFQACIDAGAEVIMTAHIVYPNIETETYVSKSTGEEITLPATLSKTLITGILRGDMGFDGVVVTDAMNMDAIAEHFDPLDAARLAIEAGVDMILMPVNVTDAEGIAALGDYITALAGLADGGKISMEKIDAAVLRILKLKAAHGLLEPYSGTDLSRVGSVGSTMHHYIEWELAKSAVTLVKNDGAMLPITGGKTVAFAAYDNEVLSMEYAIGLLREEGRLAASSQIDVYSYQKMSVSEMLEKAADADHVIAISELYREAGLDPFGSSGAAAAKLDALIEGVHEAGGNIAILSAYLPYDAARFTAADAFVISWLAKGMSEDPRAAENGVSQYGANIPAAVYLMFAQDESPAGKLPVGIPAVGEDFRYGKETLYSRGLGLSYASAPSGAASAASRARIVSALWNAEGKPVVNYAMRFADVDGEASYAEAVRWAAAQKIVYGFSAERFGPESSVTREQLAVIFMRYAASRGIDTSVSEVASLDAYSDSAQVSGWAKDAMLWAVENGIIKGSSADTLSPKGTATNSQLTTMLLRFLLGLEKTE